MKKFYFLLMMMMATAAAWSQNTYTWTGLSNSSWQNPANWQPARNTPAGSDRLIFDRTFTVSNVPTQTIGRLIIDADVTVNFFPSNAANVLTISNTTAPAFVVNGELASDVNISLADNVDAIIAGAFTINDGRTYNTTGPGNNGNRPTTTVSANGIIENRGNLISTNSNRLSFESSSSYIHARDGGDIPLADWDNNSSCNITGVVATIPTVATFDQEFGNFTWDSPGQTGNLSFVGNLQEINGNFTVANTGNTGALNLAISGADFTITVGGDYLQTGGTLNMIGTNGSCDLELMGDFSMSGGTLRRGGGTCNFIFDRNGSQSFTKTGGTIAGAINFSIDNDSEVDFGTSVLDGLAATFTLKDEAKIITANAAGLYSTGAIGSIQVEGARSFSDEADYEFRGANTGLFHTGNPANPSVVRNLTINNISGTVTLSKSVTISDPGDGTSRLYLQNGALITTTANILTLNNDVQATGVAALTANQYSLASFVDGPIRKTGDNAFTFPVGKVGSGLHKIGITAGSNTTTSFTAQFFKNDPHTLNSTLGAGLVKLSGCEYWTLDRVGSNQVRVVLSWESNSGCGGEYVTQPASLRVAHLTGGEWKNEERFTGSGNNTAGTITSNTLNSFSPFALATSSADENPLPVVFGDVKAYEKNSGVQIEWSNLTEKDVADYTVERSADGRNFGAIAQQLPTSNQNDRANYTSFDANPSDGINYYRIKAVETTGKIVYSKVLSVNLGQANAGLKLYPNPVSGNQVTISLSNVKRGQYNLRVVNTAGQDIYKQTISNQGSVTTQTIDLPSSIKPGVYNMIITGSDYRENRMFIVQ